VRPGFRAKHNYASRPGRKAGGVFLRSENAEAGPRKTAMRFMRGEAYVSAEPERERVHGVDDSVPDAAHAPVAPTGLLAMLYPKPTNRHYICRISEEVVRREASGKSGAYDDRPYVCYNFCLLCEIRRSLRR